MFDPRPELANNPVHTILPAERLHDSNNSWGDASFGAKARKKVQNYENYRNRINGGGVQFRLETMEEESGFCSPPLWSTSPPRSPVQSRNHPNNYRYLSQTARAQAIARGQSELMEMVKSMPESSYELSLKDLVEQQQSSVEEEDSMVEERSILGNEIPSQRWKVTKRQESNKKNEKKGKIMRSGSIDQNKGLLLNLVFPFSFGSKKKKSSVTNTCAKVSPKPDYLDKPSKHVERDWWKKRFSFSGESESGGNSSSSGSTGRSGSTGSSGSSGSNSSRSNSRRKHSGCRPGCWTFFHSKNSKSAK